MEFKKDEGIETVKCDFCGGYATIEHFEDGHWEGHCKCGWQMNSNEA